MLPEKNDESWKLKMHLSSSNFTLFNFSFEVQNDKYGTIYLNVSVILYVEVLLIK